MPTQRTKQWLTFSAAAQCSSQVTSALHPSTRSRPAMHPSESNEQTRALGTYASSPDRFRESLGCGSRRRTSHPPSAVPPFPDKGDGFPSPGQQRSTPPSHPDEAMDPRVSSETVTPRHACPATMHEDSANFALSRNSWLLWPPLRWRACCSCEIKDSSCHRYLVMLEPMLRRVAISDIPGLPSAAPKVKL